MFIGDAPNSSAVPRIGMEESGFTIGGASFPTRFGIRKRNARITVRPAGSRMYRLSFTISIILHYAICNNEMTSLLYRFYVFSTIIKM